MSFNVVRNMTRIKMTKYSYDIALVNAEVSKGHRWSCNGAKKTEVEQGRSWPEMFSKNCSSEMYTENSLAKHGFRCVFEKTKCKESFSYRDLWGLLS